MNAVVLFKTHGPIARVWEILVKAFGFEVVSTLNEAELVITEDAGQVHEALIAGKLAVQFVPLAGMYPAYPIDRHTEFTDRYRLFRTIGDKRVGGMEDMHAYLLSLLEKTKQM